MTTAHAIAARARLLPTVLVVEDEVLVRWVIAEYLRDCGYGVIEAASADEGLRVLQTGRHVDVVFSDIQTPGSNDGFGLAQWIRRQRPAIRVILTSGIARSAQAAQKLCNENHCDNHLVPKPYDHHQVETKIRSLLAQGT